MNHTIYKTWSSVDIWDYEQWLYGCWDFALLELLLFWLLRILHKIPKKNHSFPTQTPPSSQTRKVYDTSKLLVYTQVININIGNQRSHTSTCRLAGEEVVPSPPQKKKRLNKKKMLHFTSSECFQWHIYNLKVFRSSSS